MDTDGHELSLELCHRQVVAAGEGEVREPNFSKAKSVKVRNR